MLDDSKLDAPRELHRDDMHDLPFKACGTVELLKAEIHPATEAGAELVSIPPGARSRNVEMRGSIPRIPKVEEI